MKLKIATLFMMALILMASSCKKSDVDDVKNTDSNLQATWKRPYNTSQVGITFKADNTFSFGIYNGSSYVETITGHYETSGAGGAGRVTFSNQSGSMEACPNTTCKYDYTISGNMMVLVVNEDPCAGRSDKIQASWQK